MLERRRPRSGTRAPRATAALLLLAALGAALVGPTDRAHAGPKAATASAPPAVPDGTITTFGWGLTGNHAMASGPDGKLWFATDRGIARVTTAGAITIFSMTVKIVDLATGPDGAIWFTSASGVGRVSTDGVVSLFPGALAGSYLTVGPDGNMWTSTPTSINRITPAGAVTSFTDPAMTGVGDLVFGADGNVWFTNAATHAVGRLTTGGIVTMFVDARINVTGSITAGPDGNVWIADTTPATSGFPGFPGTPGSAALVRVTPAGAMAFLSAGAGYVTEVTAGPDGELWYGNDGTNTTSARNRGYVTHMSTTGLGAATTIATPGRPTGWSLYPESFTDDVSGLTAGPDGNVWFVSSMSNAVGRVTPGGTLTVFRGTDVTAPNAIVAGPAGDVWFTNSGPGFAPLESGYGSLGRSTAGTSISSQRAGTLNPAGLALGADGNLWFTEPDTDTVGRMTPAGISTTFPGGSLHAREIAAAADGNLWIAGATGIGRMTTAGVLTVFPTSATSITGGPDGNVWFTSGSSIGRITPAGVISMFATPVVGATAAAITGGPDGNLWFTYTSGATDIARITPAGVMTRFADASIRAPHDLTAGPDGNVWFTNASPALGDPGAHPGALGRVTPTGGFTYFSSPELHEAEGITASPGGDLWFTIRNGNGLGRVTARAIGAPGVAGFPAATSRPGGATVRWWPTAPEAGVTGGFVTPYRNGVALTPTSFAGTGGRVTIAGLVPGDTYTFTISLRAAAGTGPPSARTAPIVAGLPTAAGFPSAKAGPAGVNVYWWPQPISGGTITPFLEGVAQPSVAFSGQVSNHVVTGLAVGQHYRFTITLTNAVGLGPTSAQTAEIVVAG